MFKARLTTLLAAAAILATSVHLLSQDRGNKLLEMQRDDVARVLGDRHPRVEELNYQIRQDTRGAENPDRSSPKPTTDAQIRSLIIVVQDLQRHVAALEVEVENLKKATHTPATEGNKAQD